MPNEKELFRPPSPRRLCLRRELPEPGARNFPCGANYLAARRFNFACGATYLHQQGGKRELRNGRRLRSRRPGRASYCTRGRGKFGNREKRSVLENSFCSFFRTPDSCQEAPPPPLFFSPFSPFLSLPFFRFLHFFFFPQFSAKLVFQKI